MGMRKRWKRGGGGDKNETEETMKNTDGYKRQFERKSASDRNLRGGGGGGGVKDQQQLSEKRAF